MRFAAPLVPATFRDRLNRFAAQVVLDGRIVSVHVPSSGRLGELLVPGARVLVAPVRCGSRRTHGDLSLVRHASRWVSIDARHANRLVADLLARGAFPGVPDGARVTPEWRLGPHRIDFRIEVPGEAPLLIETKAATLVRHGLALFPDAPTARGASQLAALTGAVRRGERAAVVFVVARDDARAVAPHAAHDPRFAARLAGAARAGVALHAFACHVSPQGLRITRPLPVLLRPPSARAARLEEARCAWSSL